MPQPSISPDEYYEHFGTPEERAEAGRFPPNHVRYSPWLRPLEWLNALGGGEAPRVLGLERTLLAAFDAAAPHDALTGTPDELARLRACLAAMLRGYDRNPYLLGVGRAIYRKSFHDLLRARARVLRHYAENRVFIEASGKMRAPILITGMPRTGSTLLQRLMSEDPSSRSPRTYEMEAPLPPLARDADPLADPRIAQSGAVLGTLQRMAPGLIEKFSESHLLAATEFEESFIYMLAHHGLSMVGAPGAGSAACRALLTVEDKRPVLRYERLFFTMLDAYRPATSHWTLKAPNYAPVFPLVFETYPDVRMVVTHRNPLIVLPSVCRLLESWCVCFDREGTFDKKRFAGHTRILLDACLTVPLAHRRAHPELDARIFDCMYDELFVDPIAMVKRIYAFFDLEVTPLFEQRMAAYLAANRQGKYGRHRYSLEEYGIDGEQYAHDQREYMERYGYGADAARSHERRAALTA